ncbi:MAG: histidine phosphatase family protein [Chloroflexi bacterium]|nr:histidine phosphatase family protein [Chloroflexota bacterium]
MRLHLVRHAAVTVRPNAPGPQWRLSPDGRAAAEALAEEKYWAELHGIHTSPEPKAVATAQRIAARHELPIRIEQDLREVENRGWVAEGYDDQVQHYLAGETIDGWERRDAALARVRACIDGIVERHPGLEVGVVSHGLVLTLYLTDLLSLAAAASHKLWAGMRFPDVAVVDPEARRLERGFGQ